MKHRIAIALAATVLSTAALAGCGSNDNPEPEPTPSNSQTTTAAVEPFSTIAHIAQDERKTVARIIELGKARQADESAIVAALIAARGEQLWMFHQPGQVFRNLFGWNAQWDNRSHLDDGAINTAIDIFYEGAERPENLAKKNDVVDYAVAIQLSDHYSGREYFSDRTVKGENNSFRSTEDKVRAQYTKSLPYAQAAYAQLG
ncbi:hypothetical protein [Rhodococcus sp. BH5]|uniref:hypothetical protein n=1 Tax=Rhodococcus sp. BH5 TaxID=2871702 RepID=UPI0022CD3245|nr:hypothetical protein [Rhodococcus sp. BH5]MCZ9634973.1 hypothetical protein [Rhodococcus sp. BH5]